MRHGVAGRHPVCTSCIRIPEEVGGQERPSTLGSGGWYSKHHPPAIADRIPGVSLIKNPIKIPVCPTTTSPGG